MVTNLGASSSLVSDWLRELRDTNIQPDRQRFRTNLERIGEVMAYEISKTLKYDEVTLTTPMASTSAKVLAAQPVIVAILRAGLPLYHGLLRYFDRADSGFSGCYRRHHPNPEDHSFEIAHQYLTSPPLAGRPLIVADPMLATGASSTVAISALLEYDAPSELHLACVVATEDGINAVKDKFPGIHIWTAAIDQGLTDRAYIIPGLGDAGDLSFGEKRQA